MTFLFTDVEGSTRLWAAHPEAMAAAIRRHDELLRQVIEEHGGRVFKTVGDAVCAAFPAAAPAVAAALDAQLAVGAEDWGIPGGLRVGMALHAGTAQRLGDDYLGPSLNRIARILGAAHGGQVLLSAATAELARGALPAGVSLRDLGEARLKDLAEPERLFQLLAAGLPVEFPPLRSVAASVANLPATPTPLLGRERELAGAAALLRGDVRLLTLTGPGGAGKTQLAIRLASDLLESFPDGVTFVPLAQVRDPAAVPAALARAAGLRESAGRSALEALAEHFRDRRALLVLDNLEQVLGAAPLVAELLRACPGLRVLATSRAGLRLRGEREFPVPPLGFPGASRAPAGRELLAYPAVALFVERARAVSPRFEPGDEQARVVAEICRRLDGLPLAIELAAARVKLFPPQAILRRLSRSLDLLTSGPRDLPERHQTLRATLEWSHDLLEPEEQVLFRRLAVFEGGCTLAAAEAVCGGPPPPGATSTGVAAGSLPGGPAGVLEALSGLMDKSLLAQQVPGFGEARYAMLETVREYALERLDASGDGPHLRSSHARHFLELAEGAEPGLRAGQQADWLDRLDLEHGNLRAAIEELLRSGQAPAAARLGTAIWRFWWIHGHLSEGRRLLERVLEASGDMQPAVRARALYALGGLAWQQGAYARALQLHEESLALERELGDPEGVVRALSGVGGVLIDLGAYARAEAVFEECLTIDTERGDRRGMAFSLGSLAHAKHQQGQFVEALELYARSLDLHRELGDPHSVALTLHNMAESLRRAGDLRRARERSEASLALFREIGGKHGVAFSLLILGDVAREEGELARAAALYSEALPLFLELDYRRDVARCLKGFGLLALAAGDPGRAARLLGAAAGMWEAIGLPPPPEAAAEMDTATPRLSETLGEAAYESEWRAGAHLGMERAVELARAAARDAGASVAAEGPLGRP